MDRPAPLPSAGDGPRPPLTEATALALAGALLEEDEAARDAQLADLLRRDAALALWTLLRARSSSAPPGGSLESLAGWLGRHALDVLNCSEASSPDASSGGHPPSLDQWPACLPRHASWSARAAAVSGDELARADAEYLRALSELRPTRSSEHRPTASPPQENESHAATLLRRLVARLRRLWLLESEFQRTLEQEKLDALKELAYGASHEINNPLANISTRAQTLLRDETDPERRKKLAVINSQAFRAHEMISDMMLFARPPALQPQRVDLAEVVRDVCDQLAPLAEEQATTLRIAEAALERYVVTADGTQLRVALTALVQNSLEALGAGGDVEVSLHGAAGGEAAGDKSALRIVVVDNGPGIEPEVRRHLFDPFYSGREAGRGLGFGLSKCWRIVTLHGGRVDVESRPGCGAAFTIWLPARPEAEGKRKK